MDTAFPSFLRGKMEKEEKIEEKKSKYLQVRTKVDTKNKVKNWKLNLNAKFKA